MKTPSIRLLLVWVAGLIAACDPLETIQTGIPDGTITGLTVDADRADVVIFASGGGPSTVEVTPSEAGAAPEVLIVKKGRSVFISCQSGCGETLAIAVPERIELNVSTSTGDIDISGIKGDLRAVTNTGDVVLMGVGGVVQVESVTGTIIGRDLESPYVAAETGFGNIDFAFKESPDGTDLSANLGDVKVEIPQGRFDITTDAFSKAALSEGIINDSTASRAIHAESGSGTVQVLVATSIL